MEKEMKRGFVIVLLTFVLASTLFSVCYIMPAKASGTIYIHSDGSIDPSGSPISSNDKVTYTLTGDISGSIIVERSNIIIDGASHSIEGDGTENGFQLNNVTNVTIKNTKIENTYDGVHIESASFIVVLENNITTNSNDGIGIFDSPNTVIAGNSITWNGFYGVENIGSSYCSVSGNQIAANTYFGIGIYDSSNNNITENRVEDNYNGIELSYSPECKVYHNDFVNHTLQTSIVSSIAVWDNGYPSGGNYWSDYVGNDIYSGPYQNQTGRDGIGDTPYNCSKDNQDRYPLMKTWTNIAVQSVSPSKTVVGNGQDVIITVSVQNQGWDGQTINITVYVNTTIVFTFENVAIAGRSQTSLNFTWQTGAFSRGNDVISAQADPAPGETDTTDNTFQTWIIVTITADINGDGAVDIYDAILLSGAFNSVRGSSNWNPNADINGDGTVDIYDAIILSGNFGKKS